ncbi:Aldo/keto reductase [Mycena metata]|uniref:Aldo/keto reductase n=1 Tax=Mycena metata TaxID=1033252 RepID=A0AAD7MP88_9AGAR|nr:Aldo/keto reductase [Mycena metata]
MTWGQKGKGDARVTDVKECERYASIATDVEDIVVYPPISQDAGSLPQLWTHGSRYFIRVHVGTSEEYLGKAHGDYLSHSIAWLIGRKQIDHKSRGVIVDTKLYPRDPVTHSAADLRKFIDVQLKALKQTPMHLDGPDRKTPYTETFKAANELFQEGKFKRFGLSNYMVQTIWFFTGKYDQKAGLEKGSRFDPKGPHNNVAEKHQLLLTEVAFRWCRYHSQMKVEYGDKLIIGALSYKQLEENLVFLEKGPLPDDIVDALDQAWNKVKGVAYKYWH